MVENRCTLPAARRLRILVADDSPSVRTALQKLLTLLGHRVEVAADGAEALAALLREPFDVALLDVQMPVMSGPEAASRCPLECGGRRRPYIIAISGDDSSGERVRCASAGMDEFLAKPILAEHLAERLAQVAADRDSTGMSCSPAMPSPSV